jgi:adenine-specific DNA-methyltransferase
MLTSEYDLVSYVEYNQLQRKDREHYAVKDRFKQYFTPGSVAKLMASGFNFVSNNIRILDPGAGCGILFTACVNRVLLEHKDVKSIEVVAFEADTTLLKPLKLAIESCEKACKRGGIKFVGHIRNEDFIEASVRRNELFNGPKENFTHIIVNPPYKKLNTSTDTYHLLKMAGKASPNLYTAFLSMAGTYLNDGGELISITPRSFCNGVYFKRFREDFLGKFDISAIHIFMSRNKAFSIDKVLQENIIIKWVKSKTSSRMVKIFSSNGPEDTVFTQREVQQEEIVVPDDKERVIRIVVDSNEEKIMRLVNKLPYKISDLGLKASTGPIVDFRTIKDMGRDESEEMVPLIQPECVNPSGYIKWNPSAMRKAPFVKVTDETVNFLVKDEIYVIVKRFSSNEERKRIVASVYKPLHTYNGLVGFENRVNYIHQNGNGLKLELAKGLTVYLNSTVVDSYFRQMSGHTQVNASDLERLRYPDLDTLMILGNMYSDELPVQSEIDNIIRKTVFLMNGNEIDPVEVKKKIGEALEILKRIGMPREQQNERSALTLLALLNLKPTESWKNSSNPLIGITPMMKFFEENYGKKYAPNSRETVRRFTVHQFLQSHLINENPDDPTRPTNSPKAVYQIKNNALQLIRTFSSLDWDDELRKYLKEAPPLEEDYRGTKDKKRIRVSISPTMDIKLSPGGQNVLVKKIISLFIPRFINKPRILYIGDTEKKFLYFDENGFKSINIELDVHGKIPDVIILDDEMNWLYLIEAVTSHGPINKKRRNELSDIFGKSSAGLIYVTAFMDRSAMVKYLKEISWESEVWLAETPDHMIHFNGDRFLGPYE